MRVLRIAALCILGWASAAAAQFPDRPITMVVPFPPGGLADAVARPVAEAMSRELKQPVVVENKPGAGGGIGMAAVAKAKPDGYTILMSLSSYTVLPEADKLFGRAPMYQLDQLKPVARFTADPTVFAVRADAPWKTLQDFVNDARANPGKFTYGSSGNYGTMHVPMAMFAGAAGVKMVHVPYTGAGPAIVGLLGGQVDALSTGPATVVQQVKAGKVRVLAHWGDVRLVSLPDVPSMKESGTNVEYAQWSGLFAPAGTPDAVLQRLRDAARAAGQRSAREGRAAHGRQPGAVSRRPGVPALRRCRCREDGRRREAHRQGRVARPARTATQRRRSARPSRGGVKRGARDACARSRLAYNSALRRRRRWLKSSRWRAGRRSLRSGSPSCCKACRKSGPPIASTPSMPRTGTSSSSRVR